MLFDLEVKPCPNCGKLMMKKDKSGLFCYWRGHDNVSQDIQMKEKGVVYESNVRMPGEFDKPVCVECKDNLTFTCYLCKQEYSTKDIKESIGDPAEYLCKHCYESASAKDWEEAYEYLCKEHEYDYR